MLPTIVMSKSDPYDWREAERGILIRGLLPFRTLMYCSKGSIFCGKAFGEAPTPISTIPRPCSLPCVRCANGSKQ